MLGPLNYTLRNYKAELESLKKSYPYINCTQDQPFGTLTGCTQCSDPSPYFDIKKR